MPHLDREAIACDYFLDALRDRDLIFKIRERQPKDLDAAFRIASQLEVWTKDVDKLGEHAKDENKENLSRGENQKKMREVTNFCRGKTKT